MHFSKIVSLATLAASASAFKKSTRTFAVNHFYGTGPLTQGRMDPIVTPGGPAAHSHVVQGGNGFALNMTNNQALDGSTCTSSLIKNDKSNYWTPTLYFQDPKNRSSLEAVPMFYMNVYYFFEPTDDDIKAFEPGHRMVIGSPTLRTPPAGGADIITDLANGTPQPVQWTCPRLDTTNPLYPTNSDGLHGVGIGDTINKGSGSGFPDQNCDGYASPLRADIHFPSCYNPEAGLDNYKGNMQFPTNNNCPTGWTHTPHLFYEVYWNTPLFSDRWTPNQGTQPFVLSNGDPTGYSLHGDFLSGWDVTTLQQIIDNCNAGDSGMDQCPGLIGGVNDKSTSCNMANLWPEDLGGVLEALPGHNPVTGWGTNVVMSTGPSSTSPAASSVPKSSSKASSSTKATATSAQAAAGGSDPRPVAGDVTETVAPTPTAAAGQVTTFVTSLVSETTILYTTVSASGVKATGTPSASASGTTTAPGWSYHGCYSDSVSSRVMTGITFANIGDGEVTNTNCVAYCSAKGYSMAGTEYGGQCFCDNSVHSSSVLASSSCDMPCEGDSKQTCGGSLALSVYSKTGSSKKSKRLSRHINHHLLRHTN